MSMSQVSGAASRTLPTAQIIRIRGQDSGVLAKLRNGYAANRIPPQQKEAFRQFGRELLDEIEASVAYLICRESVFRIEVEIIQKPLVGEGP